MSGIVGLIGLGAIGAPIAHKLYEKDADRFVLVATGDRRKTMEEKEIRINGKIFSPKYVSGKEELAEELSLLIICVKNFQLDEALNDIRAVITDSTVLLPLQNGIAAYWLLRKEFPKNIVLEGYAQGPNTERVADGFYYQNTGTLHLGSTYKEFNEYAVMAYDTLAGAGIPAVFESDIRTMVWKKWMLNVAGNTVTALTGASYADFKYSSALQSVCRKIMKEFLQVAHAENIRIDENDIDDVIQYYINYNGEKTTSMLEDVQNRRRTENEYITGKLLKIAGEHNIPMPVNETMYMLIKSIESVYLR